MLHVPLNCRVHSKKCPTPSHFVSLQLNRNNLLCQETSSSKKRMPRCGHWNDLIYHQLSMAQVHRPTHDLSQTSFLLQRVSTQKRHSRNQRNYCKRSKQDLVNSHLKKDPQNHAHQWPSSRSLLYSWRSYKVWWTCLLSSQCISLQCTLPRKTTTTWRR